MYAQRAEPMRSARSPARLPWKKDIKRNGFLYLLYAPTLCYLVIFHYIPMFGVAIAFEDFNIRRGVFGSRWIGFDNFIDLFTGETFGLVMRNTVGMALLNLTIGFIAPILLALVLCEVRNKRFKRITQTITYMPFFVSTMVVCQLARFFLAREGGVTLLLSALGLPKQNWLANPNLPVFWLINCFTDIWQGTGYGSIVYVAAISAVNGDLHEAAAIDGAGRFRRIVSITIPSIKPMIIMMLTLRVGTVFMSGFDKILLLYMPRTYDVADVISTYTYRMAFGSSINYGLSAASGLFQSLVATALLLLSNAMNRRLTAYSLF
ncbi:MAG: ABC transporter permease subunit [Oscillospiraceae bacterium]|nr:ABC transporter permease subunit [Oscillospiraceae bacterium]